MKQLLLVCMVALLFVGCAGTLNKAATEYQSRVESQSVQVTVDGQSKTVGVGTTVVFRKPGEDPVKVKVKVAPVNGTATNSGGK